MDAPEGAQEPFGAKATQVAASLAGGEKVDFEQKESDQYGRVVGLVYIEGDGECLNEELVRAGHAWVYERYCRIRDCTAWQKLERRARRSERGLWAAENPIPPWVLEAWGARRLIRRGQGLQRL